MKNLEAQAELWQQARHPGAELAKFLLGHSNDPRYLVYVLHQCLEAVKRDHAVDTDFSTTVLAGG